MAINGVIEVATGDLLRWGIDVVFVPNGGEALRNDVPYPGLRRSQVGNALMHRWTGAVWITVPNVDTLERPFPRSCLIFLAQTVASVWALMPNAPTEFLGLALHRFRRNLLRVEDVTLQANVVVPGSANAKLRLQYSTDNGTNWNPLGPPPGVEIPINVAGTISVPFVKVVEGAKVAPNVLIRVLGNGGNGIVSPSFSRVEAQFR